MNRSKTPSLRVLSAALVAAGALSLAAGCTPKNKPVEEDPAMQQMDTPSVNLRVGLPDEAQQVGQQSENPSYTAASDGRIFIYNLSENQTINGYNIRKGQTLTVYGTEGRAAISGNEVTTAGQIKPGRTYLLYFNPASGASSSNSDDNGNTFRITPASDN